MGDTCLHLLQKRVLISRWSPHLLFLAYVQGDKVDYLIELFPHPHQNGRTLGYQGNVPFICCEGQSY